MKLGLYVLAGAVAFVAHEATGCSEFLYNSSHWNVTADGPLPVMSGRTMDFAADQQSVLEIIPRGTTFQERPAPACADCAGYQWNNTLGFVAINIQDMDLATDGLNEKGLSAALLAMPDALAPRDDSSSSSGSITTRDPTLPAVASICTYILGSFASVNEVREGLERIQFAGFDERLLNLVRSQSDIALSSVPFHVSVRDSTGQSLVVEFVDGKMTLFDDLERFLAARAAESGQKETDSSNDGAKFREYHPVYRVQRISAMNHNVRKDSLNAVSSTPAQRVVSRMLHILNAVRLPTAEAWSLVRDHKGPQLFIRSAQNQQLRRIDLAQIDLASESGRRSIPVAHGDWFSDISRVPVQDDSSSKSSGSELTETTQLMAQERLPAPVRPHDRLSWFSFVSGVSWGAILTLGAIYGAPWIAMQIRRRKYKQIHDLAYL